MKKTQNNQSKSLQKNVKTPQKQVVKENVSPQKQLTPNKTNNKQRSNSKNDLYNSGKIEQFPKYLQFATKQLNEKRQKMEACINLFNLMHSNNMQLRCLEHNNILTLYCLTERRILCVNCIYGITKHKTHKVYPLKDSIQFINKDNQLLKSIIDSDLKLLQQSIKNSQQNTMTLQKQLKKTLNKIQNDYKQQLQNLKNQYTYRKNVVSNVLEKVIQKSKFLQKGIQQFKFKIWQTLSKIGIGKRNDAISNQTQIVRQVFCVSLSQITKMQIKKISKKQIEKIHNQIRN